jgi:alkanesulfonate monooxygenase SsuD/methylene tetrahydromethanopterin reductase-like flavin-dependent oxidoreductase (luciferase family)
MRFSAWPLFLRPWEELLDLSRFVEADGWHGVWLADHYMLDTPDGSPSDGPGLECWALLAGLAAAVPRLQLGSLVSPTTIHHPAILAKRACTIDRMSGGRLVLGIGAGWQVNEHKAYGIDLLGPKERVDRFEEAIIILKGLLHDQRTTFAGTHFSVTDAPCEPKPVGKMEIMVGTGGPRMSRITARHADHWNCWGTPATFAERKATLVAACEREGRDPASIRMSAQAMIFLVDDPAKVAKVAERAPADRALVGTTEMLVEQLAGYVELGVDEFIVPDFTLGATHEARKEAFARIKAEVVSAL